MTSKEFLKKHFGVPENWDKFDFQTKQYSFEDIEEALLAYKNRIPVHTDPMSIKSHTEINGICYLTFSDGKTYSSSDQINWKAE